MKKRITVILLISENGEKLLPLFTFKGEKKDRKEKLLNNNKNCLPRKFFGWQTNIYQMAWIMYSSKLNVKIYF